MCFLSQREKGASTLLVVALFWLRDLEMLVSVMTAATVVAVAGAVEASAVTVRAEAVQVV